MLVVGLLHLRLLEGVRNVQCAGIEAAVLVVAVDLRRGRRVRIATSVESVIVVGPVAVAIAVAIAVAAAVAVVAVVGAVAVAGAAVRCALPHLAWIRWMEWMDGHGRD